MTEAPTATQWYIARDGKQHGPLTDAEIRMFVQSGHMRPSDLVWRAGFSDWQPAHSVFPSAGPQQAGPQAQQPSQEHAGTSGRQGHSSAARPSDTSQPRVEPRQRAEAGRQGAAGFGSDQSTRRQPEPAQPGHGAASQSGGTGRPQAETFSPGPRQPESRVAPIEDEYEEIEAEAPRRLAGGRRGAILLAAVAALVASGGWLAVQNKDSLLAMANMTAGAASNGVPVVKAEGETKTAALDQGQTATSDAEAPAATPVVDETPQKPVVTPAMIDANFQRSPLWILLKADYPEWYGTNVEEAARIVSTGTEADMAKHLIGQLVALRRQHAEHALAASTPKLINVAHSFLANLKSLASHSAATCYSFIGQGELSPAVIELFPQRGYGEAIEAQIAAIFEAVSDGRTSPVTRERATKADYDVLAAELTKLGWTKADLRVFADPKALAQTEPEKVCQMVQDWFSAHLAITDTSVQERLMYETLRPIVAG